MTLADALLAEQRRRRRSIGEDARLSVLVEILSITEIVALHVERRRWRLHEDALIVERRRDARLLAAKFVRAAVAIAAAAATDKVERDGAGRLEEIRHIVKMIGVARLTIAAIAEWRRLLLLMRRRLLMTEKRFFARRLKSQHAI